MSDRSSDSDYTAFGTLRVESPSPLPEMLDILVAGGGPAGTAAAMRARELGLSCMVIRSTQVMYSCCAATACRAWWTLPPFSTN